MPGLSVAGRLQEAAQAAAEAARARYAAVITYGPDDAPSRVVCGATTPDTIAATYEALRRHHLLDQPQHPGAEPHDAVQDRDPQQGDPFRSYFTAGSLVLPIETEDGPYGSIVVLDPIEGEFTTRHRSLVASVAERVAAGLERATAVEEMQRRVDWLDASALVSRQLLDSSWGLMRVVQDIGDHVLRLSAARGLTIAVVSPDDPVMLEVRVAAGVGAANLLGRTHPEASSVAGRAMEQNRGVLNFATDLYYLGAPTGPSSSIAPVMAVPIHGGDGRPRGAIVAHRRTGQPPFDLTDLSMAEDFARQTSLALQLSEKRTVQEQLEERRRRDQSVDALHDDAIQRLFSVGLAIHQAEADLRSGAPSPAVDRAQSHLARAVDDLNETIRQVRVALHPATVATDQTGPVDRPRPG